MLINIDHVIKKYVVLTDLTHAHQNKTIKQTINIKCNSILYFNTCHLYLNFNNKLKGVNLIMSIIMKSNKKMKRVSFLLNEETQNMENENRNLAQELGAKLSYNEDLNRCYLNLLRKTNKELQEMVKKKPPVDYPKTENENSNSINV